MDANYENTVLDFDLNLFQCNSIPNKNDKQRIAIKTAKKKIIATNILIRRFYDKKQTLEHTEKNLINAKEECKKVCIDYKSALEKCSELEKTTQFLKEVASECEKRCVIAETQNSANESHANQLQQVVKENETLMQALKLENQLAKENSRNCVSRITALENKNETLKKYLQMAHSVIIGKKKLSTSFKQLLQNFDHSTADVDGDISSDHDHSDNESFIDDSPISPPNTHEELMTNLSKENENGENSIFKHQLQVTDKVFNRKTYSGKDETDRDSDSNEIVSIDTGCASSLSFSDSFLSPETYIEDGSNPDEVRNNTGITKHTTTMRTSPFRIITRHIATSPIKFNENKISPKHLKNTATSPLIFQCSMSGLEEKNLSRNTSFTPDELVTNRINNSEGQKEKEYLELNNGDKFSCEDNSNDLEIEAILNTMRFNRNLITPLPSSPSKSRNTETATCTESISIHPESVQARSQVCLEASKIREENKILHSSIADLAKEVMNIKSLLKNQLLSGHCRQTEQDIPIDTPLNVENIRSKDDCLILDINLEHKIRLKNKNNSDIHAKHLDQRKEELNLLFHGKKEINSSIKRHSCDENNPDNRNYDLEIRTSDIETNIFTTESEDDLGVINVGTKHLLPTYCKNISIESQDNTLFHVNKACMFKDMDAHEKSNSLNFTCDNFGETSSKLQKTVPTNKDATSDSFAEISNRSQENYETIEDAASDNLNAPNKSNELNLTTTCDNFEEISNRSQKNYGTNKDATNDSIIDFCNKPQDSREMLLFDDFLHDEESQMSVVTKYSNENGNSENGLTKNKDQSLRSRTTYDDCKRLPTKRRKLTRLGKLRRNMIPRNKIKSAEVIRKRPLKLKAWHIIKDKKKFNESYSSVLLNNREAYEKALKVMSEVKAKQKLTEGKKRIRKVIKRMKNNEMEEVANNKKNDELITHTIVEASANSQHNATSSNTNVDCDKRYVINNEDYENNQSIISEKDSFVEQVSENKQIHESIRRPEATFDKKLNNETDKKRKIDKVFENKQSKENSLIPARNVKTRSCSKNGKVENLRNNIQADDIINKYSQPVGNFSTTMATNYSDGRSRKRRIKSFQDQHEIENKRVLRSSTINKSHISENSDNITQNNKSRDEKTDKDNDKLQDQNKSFKNKEIIEERENVVYKDLDLFSIESSKSNNRCDTAHTARNTRPKQVKESIFYTLLEKYAVNSIKTKNAIPNSISNKISETITNSVEKISQLNPKEAKTAMDLFVDSIKANVNLKHFVIGLMKYLNDPERKADLYSKSTVPGAPQLTKPEQILLYVLAQLKLFWPDVDIVDIVLNNIEYTLFRLNGTPDFNTIESMSHFYAVVCRYFKARSRLRLFMLDAMYCIQYKAIPLIKQCLEVWMHALPLAHMGIAKSPLVICLVYLLHFFKCNDRFHRVSEIRMILYRKYSYQLSDWNETRILESFKNAIVGLRSNTLEEKTLRLALIILAKRQGAKWCQNKMIKNLLLPIIDDCELPERIRSFCVSILGPLMKPFPDDMKVHCVIVMNKLIDTLAQKPSPAMQEAIISSLVYMSRHDNNRVLKLLLFWSPEKISPWLEELLRGYIMEKPAKKWKFLISNV